MHHDIYSRSQNFDNNNKNNSDINLILRTLKRINERFVYYMFAFIFSDYLKFTTIISKISNLNSLLVKQLLISRVQDGVVYLR